MHCEHLPNRMCVACEQASHPLDCVETMGCLVHKGLQLAAGRFATQRRGGVVSGEGKDQSNAWERGVVRDHRGLPLLEAATLEPIPIKRYAENRRNYEAQRRQLHQRTQEGRAR